MTGPPNTWRLLIDGAVPGAENMARDEALARCAGAGAKAVLRTYSFEPPAITIGRFQRFPAAVDLRTCASGGISVVRRPTGGLAILHASDFTYSVVVPSSASGVSMKNRVFNTVAGAIISALETLGIQAHQVSRGIDKRRHADWCFEGVFGVDLEWHGRKICGSAQRSMAGCILQHGSLFLKEPEVNTNSIFASAEPVRSPEAPFVTLGEAAGRDITWEQVLAAFKTGFERSLGVDFKHDSLSPEEEAVARRLTDEKYRNSEWLGHTEHTGHVGRL